MDSVVNIPGYTVLRKGSGPDNQDGACFYIRNDNLMYTELHDLLCCTSREILWGNCDQNIYLKDSPLLLLP